MRELIKRFREEFFKELDSKPSWGKDQIKALFIHTLNNVLLGNINESDDV